MDTLHHALAELAKYNISKPDKLRFRVIVDQEYGPSREIEKKWQKKIKLRNLLDWHQICLVVHTLCTELGQKPVKKIFFDPTRRIAGAAAHYSAGVIYLYWDYSDLFTIIHELTHHFLFGKGVSMHGKEFCEIEEILFNTFWELKDRFPFMNY